MKKLALGFYVFVINPILIMSSLFGILVGVATLFEKWGI